MAAIFPDNFDKIPTGAYSQSDDWDREVSCLREFSQTWMNSASGDFLFSLLRGAAKAFKVRGALVSEWFGSEKKFCRTLSFSLDAKPMDTILYPLAGTPCSKVYAGEIFFVPEKVRQKYPNARPLQDFGAESYLGIPLRDRQGKICGIFGLVDDKPMPASRMESPILFPLAVLAETEIRRRQAETNQEAIAIVDHQSGAFLQAIVDNALDLIFTVDRNHRYLTCNPRVRSYGLNPEDMVGKSIFDFVPGDKARFYADLHDKVFATGEPLRVESSVEGVTGKFWHSSIYSPIFDDKGNVTAVACVARDISEAKQAEEDLKKNHLLLTDLLDREKKAVEIINEERKKAEALNRSKSQFLANLSHEIRTPLNSIIGYSDYLSRHPELGRTQLERMLGIIADQSNNLLNLVNNILDFSKMESGQILLEFLPCEPLDIAAGVISAFKQSSDQKNIKLLHSSMGKIPEEIITDSMRLKQILANLVGNAIKFTPEGRVELRISEFGGGDYLRFDIEDTGIGIPLDKLGIIMEPFTQADASTTRQYGGTGLGLTISNQLADLLGGWLEVESRVRNPLDPTSVSGCVFSVFIPCKPKVETPVARRATDKFRKTGFGDFGIKGLRILSAEDDRYSRESLKHLMQYAGAEITTCENGREVLAVFKPGFFDIVLLDMQMPILDGYETARRLKTSGCSVPIIACTAHAMADDRTKCLEAGCDDYIAKPLTLDKISRVILQNLKNPSGG